MSGASSSLNYVVTAHPPTAITACATGTSLNLLFNEFIKKNSILGNFTSPTDLNLILAKVNHIEVLSVTPEGLRPIKQFTINGRVEVMKFFRPQGLDKDRLFIVTAKNNAMILEADDSGNTLEIITKARGDVGDRIGQNAQTGTRAIIDPEARVIGLRIYDSLFKVNCLLLYPIGAKTNFLSRNSIEFDV